MVFNNTDTAVIETLFREKGWRGKRIVQEFPNKQWNKDSINRLIRKIVKTGSSERQKGSGRPKTARTDNIVRQVEELALSQEDDPGSHKSQRKIASRLKISRRSVGRIIKRDLKLNAYKRIKTSRKSENVKEKRKTRSRSILDKFNSEEVKQLVFTDEKDFTLEVSKNRHNDVVYGRKKSEILPKRLYREKNRFSKKIMVSAGVCWRGKTNIHFIDTTKTKVNAANYISLLQDKLLPDCRALYPRGNFIFQQDGAPSHTSKETQAFLNSEKVRFIKKDEWPPMSADLNPMDYAIWNSLSEKVYSDRSTPFTERELKDKILECWGEISITEIRHAISSWKKRLRFVCKESGGSTEHLYN